MVPRTRRLFQLTRARSSCGGCVAFGSQLVHRLQHPEAVNDQASELDHVYQRSSVLRFPSFMKLTCSAAASSIWLREHSHERIPDSERNVLFARPSRRGLRKCFSRKPGLRNARRCNWPILGRRQQLCRALLPIQLGQHVEELRYHDRLRSRLPRMALDSHGA